MSDDRFEPLPQRTERVATGVALIKQGIKRMIL
jgi:hypothetical protein